MIFFGIVLLFIVFLYLEISLWYLSFLFIIPLVGLYAGVVHDFNIYKETKRKQKETEMFYKYYHNK